MNIKPNKIVCAGFCSLLVFLISTVDAFAAVNRKAVTEIIQQLDAEPGQNQLDIWINDNPIDPGVKVGSELTYHISSARRLYYLMILVDPKGATTIVLPDGLVSKRPQAYRTFVYPPAGTGSVTQGEPVGIETVYVLASTQPVSRSLLGIEANSDLLPLPADLEEIRRYFSRLQNLTADDQVILKRYRYRVDADTQYGTRAMRRELQVRVEQIDLMEEGETTIARTGELPKENDAEAESEALSVSGIRFETNSAVLTQRGQVQLDVLGSELMAMWEKGGLPTISLEGHTDDRGQDDYNQELSEKRANSARSYLIAEFDFPVSKLVARGKGEKVPLVPNTDSAARALNRRVDIRVLK